MWRGTAGSRRCVAAAARRRSRQLVLQVASAVAAAATTTSSVARTSAAPPPPPPIGSTPAGPAAAASLPPSTVGPASTVLRRGGCGSGCHLACCRRRDGFSPRAVRRAVTRTAAVPAYPQPLALYGRALHVQHTQLLLALAFALQLSFLSIVQCFAHCAAVVQLLDLTQRLFDLVALLQQLRIRDPGCGRRRRRPLGPTAAPGRHYWWPPWRRARSSY